MNQSSYRPQLAAPRPWVVLSCLLLLVVAACRGAAPRPPFDPADPQGMEARLQEHLRAHPEDDLAWRDLAHLQWIHLGKTDEALPVLDRLANRGDPVARLSRTIIAQSREEPEVVQQLSFAALGDLGRTAADDRSYRLLRAEAEHAAALLEDELGELEGDDARFVALFDRLPIESLPFGVQRPLLSTRAAIARRHGEDYRPFYDAQGCVQAWRAGPVEGSRGAVELSRAEPEQPIAESDAAVVALACVARVWNPAPSPGIRRMVTYLQAPGGPVLLNLAAEEPTRFYLDGTVVFATDGVDRYTPGRVTVELDLPAGWHRLEVHTTIPSERSWVMVRALTGSGAPLHADAAEPATRGEAWSGAKRRVTASWPDAVPGIEGPIYAPLRAYLAVDAALADGDSDRAEREVAGLATAEQFPQGHLVRARFERADPSRGRTISLAREVEALERALELDPALDAVRLRLLRIQRDRGEDAEVERALRELPDERLAGIDGQLLRFSVFLGQGNEYLAEQALTKASAINPNSCEVLLARRTLARERADVRAEDEIAGQLVRCAGSLGLRARLAESRGRWDEAVDLWLEMLERSPDDLSAHENLSRVLALRGSETEAREHLREAMRYNPYRVGSHLALADLAASQGNLPDAENELRLALHKIPQSNALWRAAGDLGLHDDLMDFRTDGLAALAEYRAAGTPYEGVGEVLVLDRSVARVYDNGGQRQIVHIMAHLLSKEALDEYGELSIPEGAELLQLRSIKPDGRTLEPEIVPGKDGVSLRHLEIGDVVEYEFVVERGPAGAVPGYVDVSTFRFQSADVPYHRSELLVVHSDAITLKVDARNGPPAEQVSTVQADGRALTVHHFRAQEVPRLGVEPGGRGWLAELPSVHVYTELDLPRYLDGLAAQIRDTQRRNPALRRLVREITRGQSSPEERLRSLWTWVVENVEDAGDLSMPATVTLAGRTGSRLILLRAMLREAGIDAELWLARDGYGPAPLPGGHPLVDSYEAAMLAVSLPGHDEPLMVMTASKVMPLGYLAPAYRRTEGLRVQLEDHEGPSGPVKLPDAPAGLHDARRYAVTFELDRSGGGTVHGTITLQGMEALLWRQALRQIDRDRIEEVFEQAELGWLPGATLTELELLDEDDLDRPLQLRFSARVSQVGVSQDGALVLRTTPMPLNPAANFATLPQRNTELVVPYAPDLQAELRYRFTGAKVGDLPPPVVLDSPYGHFEREVVEGKAGDAAVTLRIRSTLRTGVVEPSGYQELAGFARQVEHAVQDVLRAR